MRRHRGRKGNQRKKGGPGHNERRVLAILNLHPVFPPVYIRTHIPTHTHAQTYAHTNIQSKLRLGWYFSAGV